MHENDRLTKQYAEIKMKMDKAEEREKTSSHVNHVNDLRMDLRKATFKIKELEQ